MNEVPIIVRIVLSLGSFSVALGVCALLFSFVPWKHKTMSMRLIKIGAMMMVLPFASCTILFFIAIGISILR